MAISTTVRMSSFSLEDGRFASTSRKQLADTWKVGLYELWTESGVCCKHHRRQGLLLAYEALWRIKWQMIETWLSGYGHKDEVNVTNLPKLFWEKVAITQ